MSNLKDFCFKKVFRIFSTLLVSLVVLISCRVAVTPEEEIVVPEREKSVIQFSVHQEQNSIQKNITFLPPDINIQDFSKYELTGTSKTGDTLSEDWESYADFLSTNFSLYVGIWDFEFVVYRQNGSEKILHAKSLINNYEITKGTKLIEFDELSIIEDEGECNLIVEIPYKSAANLRISQLLNNETVPELNCTKEDNEASGKTIFTITGKNIKANPYLFSLEFMTASGHVQAKRTILVQIAGGRKTTGTTVFTEINQAYDIHYIGLGEPRAYTITEGFIGEFNKSMDVTLPTAAQINCPFDIFEGWYDNPDFTGSPITGWAKGTKSKAVSLYPKFSPKVVKVKYVNFIDSDYKSYSEFEEPEQMIKSYTFRDDVTLKSASNTYFDFDGWYYNSSYAGSAATDFTFKDVSTVAEVEELVTNGITLYTKWTPKKFPVKLADADTLSLYPTGKIDFCSDLLTPEFNTSFVLTDSNGAEYENQVTFDGWYSDKDFTSEKITKLRDVSLIASHQGLGENSVILYAKWKYKYIFWDPVNGSDVSSDSLDQFVRGYNAELPVKSRAAVDKFLKDNNAVKKVFIMSTIPDGASLNKISSAENQGLILQRYLTFNGTLIDFKSDAVVEDVIFDGANPVTTNAPVILVSQADEVEFKNVTIRNNKYDSTTATAVAIGVGKKLIINDSLIENGISAEGKLHLGGSTYVTRVVVASGGYIEPKANLSLRTGYTDVAKVELFATDYPTKEYNDYDSTSYYLLINNIPSGLGEVFDIDLSSKPNHEYEKVNNIGIIRKKDSSGGGFGVDNRAVSISLDKTTVKNSEDTELIISAVIEGTETKVTGAANYKIQVISGIDTTTNKPMVLAENNGGTDTKTDADFEIKNEDELQKVIVKAGCGKFTSLQIYVQVTFAQNVFAGTIDLTIEEDE